MTANNDLATEYKCKQLSKESLHGNVMARSRTDRQSYTATSTPSPIPLDLYTATPSYSSDVRKLSKFDVRREPVFPSLGLRWSGRKTPVSGPASLRVSVL